ncbi:O-methyltransferase [Polyplosphaeria fusca]|uniref:O-methyltransferase n=1 Tax=Polyplosphaeria fusca TaxID=682080 RepID=A0A9P4UVU2_9PLEO|nr:O-methyltransferase [Polyplosphaeria fusca]
MANENPDISALLKDIEVKGASATSNTSDENARKALLESARSLVAALDPPFEVVAKMNWVDPYKWSTTRVAYDLNLFDKLLADNNAPKSCEKLSEMTGADSKLLSRMLKFLASCGFVAETNVNEFAPNAITAVLATRIVTGMTKNCYDTLAPVIATLPEFMSNTKYANPTDKNNSPFNFAHKTSQHYFEWLAQPENADQLQAMKDHMEFKTLGKKWFQSVDIPVIFNNLSSEKDATLMIDIGGSAGHDIIDFQKTFPELPGRLILQELPSVIASLPSIFPTQVEKVPHDMFTSQPVKGAKVYYLHMVLHDWPDESCRNILKNLIPAMKKGYSKILLNEIVVPDTGAGWFATGVDMLMMQCHAAQERTESDWRALVESVGLSLSKVWECEGSAEGLLEIELA